MEALSVHQTRPYAPPSLSCRRLIWSGALPALERVYWMALLPARRRETPWWIVLLSFVKHQTKL